MNAPAERFELRMQRFIRAPREKVFDAFVNPESITTWQCPRGMSVPQARTDPRVGGQWALTMLARDGTRFELAGTYRELKRPDRLVYSFAWRSGGPMPGVETVVEVDLLARDGGTELRLLHHGFADGALRDSHAHGWSSTLNQLVDRIDERGTAATLTLLGDARSTYTRTVRMALAEKGLAHGFERAGPHTPTIDALHPFGRIPVLRDGDIVLWETSAILRYLDEGFDAGPSLVPGTVIGRARCEQWVSAISSYCYDTMVRRYVLQLLFPRGADGRPDRGVIDSALAEMPRQLAALDAAYGAGDWLAGGALSMADLLLAPILAYVEAMPDGARLLTAAPNVQRAQRLMRARASFIATEPPRG